MTYYLGLQDLVYNVKPLNHYNFLIIGSFSWLAASSVVSLGLVAIHLM